MANIQPLDPNLALANEQTLPEIISRGLWAPSMGAGLFGILGLLALGLAWMGTYAVTAFMVAQRTREIGIRMALGANRSRVVSTIIRGAAGTVAIGLIIGTSSALALTHFVASMLYGLEPRDPVAIATAVVLLSTAVVLASCLPALRASRLDPMIALRYE